MILALDLASVSGWAVGEPGSRTPAHGTIRFAAAGASHEAIFAKAYDWTTKMMDTFKPNLVVWEAPLPTSFRRVRGKTNADTTSILFGLPAVVGAAVYASGIYDIRKAETNEVRRHFIFSNPKRVKAKPLVMQQCRAMGWEIADDNEADALATWSYMCAILDPKLSWRPMPLLRRA